MKPILLNILPTKRYQFCIFFEHASNKYSYNKGCMQLESLPKGVKKTICVGYLYEIKNNE